MAVFQPPPTWAEVIILDERAKKATFNPIWLKWFIDLVNFINASGGGGGGAVAHNSTTGLQGGQANQFYHLTATEYATLQGWMGNQAARAVLAGPFSGGAATPAFKNLTSITWKGADTNRASTTSLADDPDLLFAITANSTWVGRCFIDLTNALSTTGAKVTIAAPSGASGNIHAYIVTNASGGQEVQVLSTNTLGAALDFTAAGFPPSATVGGLIVEWRVANGANAGNISFQWAQSTSSLTNLTVGAGSQMKADRVA